MKKKLVLIVVLALVVLTLLVLVLLPVVSATVWKSNTLSKNNNLVGVINETTTAITTYNGKTDPTSADIDTLLAAYTKERLALQDAQSSARKVTGFKGLDLFGAYQEAQDTSDKLMDIYNDLLLFNSGEVASSEAERELLVTFEDNADLSNAAAMRAAAADVEAANKDYQDYLKSDVASDVERQFSEVIGQLVVALNNAASAIDSNDVAKLDASTQELTNTVTALEALEPARQEQTAANQKKVQEIVDRLNAAAKELE
jgi:hypothetical protein